MGKQRVDYLVFGLIWILVFDGNVAQDTLLDVTTADVPTSTQNESTTLPECDWKIWDNETGSLWVTWSGDNITNEIEIQAVNLNPDPECLLNDTILKQVKNDEKPVNLEVCSNEEYNITIQLENCWGNEKAFWTRPGPPLNIEFSNITNSSFEVKWKKPSGSGEIQHYRVQVVETYKGFPLGGEEESLTIQKLQPYTHYTVQITALNSKSWGEVAEAYVRTAVGVPSVPSNLQSSNKTDTSVTLQWDEPTPSTGPIIKYIVEWRKSTKLIFELATQDNTTEFTLLHLLPFSQYRFRVAAETTAGRGNWSNEIVEETEIGVPPPPADLESSEITNTTVLLTWNEPEPTTGPVITYTIRWNSTEDSGTKDTNSDSLSYNVTDLLPYTTYTFDVAASTSAGRGEWSNNIEVQTTIGVPHPPTNLYPEEVSNTSVLLKWEKPVPSTGPLSTYTVQWNSSSHSEIVDTNSTEETYNVIDLLPFVKYSFKVAASTEVGRGQWSTDIETETDVGVPHSPTGLNQSEITNTSVLLSWNEPEPSTGPVTTYTVRWQSANDSGERDTNSMELKFNVTDLLPYVNYKFQVAAFTKAGRGHWSEVVEAETSVGVPHPPINLKEGKITNTSVLLTWDEPETSTGPLTTYTVRWSGTGSSGIKNINSIERSYNVIGLLPYVNYTFEVAASTDAGRGPWSTKLHIQTDIGVPHPPTDLNKAAITSTTVLLTWKEPQPSTGPISHYTVNWESSRNSGFSVTSSPKESLNVIGLLPYLNYSFKVAASTKAGRGDWSKIFEIQTDIGVPTEIRNLRIEHFTNVSISLKWNRPEFPNAPELNYHVLWQISSKLDGSEGYLIVSAPSDKGEITCEILNLLPYTNYSVRVFASTRAGRGPTNQLEVRTKIGVPQPAVILEAKALPNRAALVHWTPVGIYPGPVNFSLQAWKLPGPCSNRKGDYVAKELTGTTSADEWNLEQKTKIEGLSPFGNYSFLLVLKTLAIANMDSEKSNFIRLAPEEPSEPLQLVAECIDSPTRLKVSWTPPSNPNGAIEYYNVEYGIEDQRMMQKVQVSDMCLSQSIVLRGLRPEREYSISVRAHVKGVMRDGQVARPSKVCTLPAGIPYLGNTSHLFVESVGPDQLIFEWTKYTFSDYMGDLVRYAVLVGRLESLGNSTSGKSASIEPPWSNFTSGRSDFYQATPLDWNPFIDGPDPLECQTIVETEGDSNRTFLRCFIGVQKKCPENESYCNGPLDPDTHYELKIRAFTRGGFTETKLLYAHSGKLPGKSIAGTIVAILVVLLILLSLLAGGYVLKKKGYFHPIREHIISKIRTKEKPSATEFRKESLVVQMQQHISSKPVKIKDFVEHVRIMMSDSHLLFSSEFEELKKVSPQLPCNIAETDENRSKNRWMNIFPFDHSRVKLLPLCDDPGSDFINANYIPGYFSQREYIATQGPLPHTVDDFWRMVWEQSVNMIIMLTQCLERGKKKCEKYWPDSGESQYFNDLIITNVSESMLSSYIIRIFHIQLGSKERQVRQMHFTHWPDFGCPECPEDLINFVYAVRDHLPRVEPGPIVVHCSAGVGRTGTYIAVDRLSRQLHNSGAPGNDTVDIYGIILELRNHRTNMVQTEDQYIYIHLCVQHLIQNLSISRQLDYEENIYSNVGLERDTQM